MAKILRRIAVMSIIFSFLLLTNFNLSYGRSIKQNSEPVSNEKKAASFLERGVGAAATDTCEQTYGFLPCSTNVWGLLFLIVVYEILLSIGGQYVGNGSNLFFQMIGPGVLGASLFQVLGTIPQIILVLDDDKRRKKNHRILKQRATLGMGLIAGTTVMLLTIVWGASIVAGSYNLSESNPVDTSAVPRSDQRGVGVVTDAETSYTARIMLISLLPFIFILVAPFLNSSARRVIILVALIVTIVLLLGYMFYQIFQPSIQNRRFEYLVNKYAKDKILRLLARNGKPDLQKIQAMFKSLDRNNNSSVSAAELRVLFLGVNMDDNSLRTERDVENILASFDTTGDGRINQDEFIKGMTKLVSDRSDQTPDRLKWFTRGKSQTNGQAQQPLLSNNTKTTTPTTTSTTTSNSWLNYLTATYYVVVGTAILCALSEPLIKNVIAFAQAANMSSFCVSYLAIPLAMNYGIAIQSITSARQKTQKSISLTLSALYGGVYMNNIIGLIVFLAPVYARNLTSNPTTEALVVLIICILTTLCASLRTVFSLWMGYVGVVLYPISLAIVYVLTSVLDWS